MEAITILMRCRNAAGDIRKLRESIQRRREALVNIGAPQADPNGGSRSHGDHDKTGKLLADVDALERRLEARNQDRPVELAAACVLLDMLPELESRVLHAYYVKRESTPGIARRLKYQESYIRRVKRRGEKLLGELTPEQVAETLPAWYLRNEGKDGST